jgi:hypothetical protein
VERLRQEVRHAQRRGDAVPREQRELARDPGRMHWRLRKRKSRPEAAAVG